jgi:tRNA pseudouridine(55) synthase
MEKYIVIEKRVGETPLQALERFRALKKELKDAPLAYAGRLDPMASGKLLVLIGNECKRQVVYHGLDKEYEFEILFGVRSDTNDILGIIDSCTPQRVDEHRLRILIQRLVGPIELPYPHFSSKTVRGKPLFAWTLEGKLDEIHIPTKKSTIYVLKLADLYQLKKGDIRKDVLKRIDSLPTVTEPSKELGDDFRRVSVKSSWGRHLDSAAPTEFTIAKFRCIVSSGTYMRTLAELIAQELGGCGLAFSIKRTKLGTYIPLFGKFGLWKKQY